MEIIERLTREPEIGEEFDGVVKRIEPYGAFVEILPNQDGLLHISELAMERTPDIRDVLTEGDEIGCGSSTSTSTTASSCRGG